MEHSDVLPGARAAGATESVLAACRSVTHTYTRGGSRTRRLLGGSAGAQTTVTALDDVTVAIRRGEIVGVVGPSGSGKSTLLHLLAALTTPSEGSVVVDGRETSELSARARTRVRLDSIGIVFQRFHLLPALSARANVALPLVERGVGKHQRRARAESLLAQVGLEGRASHKPGELSGGEQQRVAIARALVTDPALVLADEPTGELDTETAAGVLEVFERFADERAVVIASHDEAIFSITDRRIDLRDGRIVTDGA